MAGVMVEFLGSGVVLGMRLHSQGCQLTLLCTYDFIHIKNKSRKTLELQSYTFGDFKQYNK